MSPETEPAFAIWITGLPASGKSTLARALKERLNARGLDVAVLESDALRKILTPNPAYDEHEREIFYQQVAYIGALLVQHGVPVIFDATANRRAYREDARSLIPNFLEVYVECPLEVCMARDPKGIYRQGRESHAQNVPGLQTAYEPPESPEIRVRGDRVQPDMAADRVISRLVASGYIDSGDGFGKLAGSL